MTPPLESFGSLAALNAALAKAQGEFPVITRDKEVTVKTRDAGSYTFRYAELGAILAAVRPVLSKHGLAITQPLEDGAIRTELRHADGGVVSTRFPFPRVPESPQQLGSLITYLRRYCLVALLGIASDDDDDAGQAADGKPDTKPESKPKLISEAQRKRLFAIAKEHDVDEARLRGYVKFYTGDDSTATIPVDKYEQIVKAIEADEDIPF